MSNAIDMQLIADYGGTMLWPMIALSNIAQGSAVLGMIVLQKKNTKAQEINVPSCISCYLGVTEPAMFGVNLKYVFPFVCGMIGSACAAVVCVATGSTANAIGVGGIPGILSMQPQYMLSFAVCMLIAIAVPFLLTIIVGKKKLAKEDLVDGEFEEKTDVAKVVKEELNIGTLRAFADGKAIALADVNDGVFSAGVMGDGLAIVPTGDTVYAPADAKVSVLMEESKHACGLVLSNGMEILLHVGIDTVDMKGDGFEYLVAADQEVKAGTPLIRFDREKIKAAGHPDTIVCVVTETGSTAKVEILSGMDTKANETKIIRFN